MDAAQPGLISKHRRTVLWAIAWLVVGAAFWGTRLVAFHQFSDTIFARQLVLDAEWYQKEALKIARGEWQGETAYFMSPGWPILLGTAYKIFGVSIAVGRALNMCLSFGTMLLLAFTGARISGRGLALVVAIAWTLFRPALFYEQTLLMETSAGFFLAALLAFWVAMVPTLVARSVPAPARWAGWIGLGAVIAVNAWFRANVVVVAPVLGVAAAWMVWTKDDGPIRGRLLNVAVTVACMAFGFFALLAPAAWHNWRAERIFVPMTTNLGLNLWIGVGPTADGTYVRPPSATDNQDPRGAIAAREELGRVLNSREVENYWKGAAMESMTFARVARLTWRKLCLFFSPADIPQLYMMDAMSAELPFLRWPLLSHFLLLIGIFPGAYWLIRSRIPVQVAVAVSAFALITSLLPFFMTDRYRLAIAPWTVLVSMVGVCAIGRALRRREWREVSVLLLLIMPVCIGLTQSPSTAGIELSFAKAKAVLYLKEKNYAEALRLITPVNATHPDSGSLATEASIAEEAHQDYGRAASLYKQALELSPISAKLWFNYAQALLRLNRKTESERAYARAVGLDPDISPTAWQNLAALRYSQGDRKGAEHAVGELLARDPGNAAGIELAARIRGSDKLGR